MSFITSCLTPAAANDLVAQLSSSGALPHACSSLGLSLWNLVRLSDAGMLDAVLNALETAAVQEDELLLASSLHALELLSAHAITPNQLRKLLALFVARDRAGLTCKLLRLGLGLGLGLGFGLGLGLGGLKSTLLLGGLTCELLRPLIDR